MRPPTQTFGLFAFLLLATCTISSCEKEDLKLHYGIKNETLQRCFNEVLAFAASLNTGSSENSDISFIGSIGQTEVSLSESDESIYALGDIFQTFRTVNGYSSIDEQQSLGIRIGAGGFQDKHFDLTLYLNGESISSALDSIQVGNFVELTTASDIRNGITHQGATIKFNVECISNVEFTPFELAPVLGNRVECTKALKSVFQDSIVYDYAFDTDVSLSRSAIEIDNYLVIKGSLNSRIVEEL